MLRSPALWGYTWYGHGCPHLRLGPNRLQFISSCHALVGRSQHWLHSHLFLLVHHRRSLREAFFLCPVFAFSVSSRSTITFGTALTFLWFLHNPLITPGIHITSPKSSTQICPSISRLTGLTALCFSPRPSPSHTGSCLQRSLPPAPTHSSTTANMS
jgi:hypothetical protein